MAKAVKAIMNDAEWVDYARAAGGWVAAFKQIWESGKILYAKRERIETAGGVEIHQPWMEKIEEEIRGYLRDLLSFRRALSGYFLEVFKGSVVQLPGNIAAAFVLMGTQAFTDFLTSIRDHIDTMNTTVLLETMSKRWKKPKDRVIGDVVWAPPISLSTAPHGYTEDFCVVKLDKK